MVYRLQSLNIYYRSPIPELSYTSATITIKPLIYFFERKKKSTGAVCGESLSTQIKDNVASLCYIAK